MNRMCSEPDIYEVDAYWKTQGITDSDQVRHEVLWLAAGRREVPIHTGKCSFCAEMLESFQRMHGILETEESVTVAVCPSAEVFSRYYYGEKNPTLANHIKICSACREDLAYFARSQQPRERAVPVSRRLVWLAVAAAAVVFTLIPWPWMKRPTKPARNFQQSSQYAKLAQVPIIDVAELMAESPADHHTRIQKVLDIYNQGDYKTAGEFADVIVRAVDDPSAGYLMAMSLYKQGKVKEALESMRTAEATEPLSSYRCWGALQFALMVGDKETIRRELKHVDNDPKYQDRCRQIEAQLKS